MTNNNCRIPVRTTTTISSIRSTKDCFSTSLRDHLSNLILMKSLTNMDSQRRHFLLNERISLSEIPKMLGRVVSNKYLPMENYAPRETLASTIPWKEEANEPNHNTNDIIPNILPPPSKQSTLSDFMSNNSNKNISASLAVIFGIGSTFATERSVKLESGEVNRYSLSNPNQAFARLMDNEYYARDVSHLLQEQGFGKGKSYFVTGFLTTRNTTWTFGSTKSSAVNVSVAAPVVEALGGVPVPVAGILPGLNPEFSTVADRTRERSRTVYVEDEEIFAVAYYVVKKRLFVREKRNDVKGKVGTGLSITGPVRIKPRHLVYSSEGQGSDEEEEEEYEEGTGDEQYENEEAVEGFELVDEEEDDEGQSIEI